MQLDMARLVEGKSTKSDKIRTLGAAGYSRSEIAKFLDIRYQHVRNVLVAEEAKNGPGTGLAGPSRTEDAPSNVVWTKVSEGGRVVLPAAFRKRLGIEEGDDIQLELEDDRVTVRTRKAAVRKLQSYFARARDPERSVVDAFLAERRAMWGED